MVTPQGNHKKATCDIWEYGVSHHSEDLHRQTVQSICKRAMRSL